MITECRKGPRKQCAKCPWKVDVDPFDIPDGYSPDKHTALSQTIARPGELRLNGPMHIFTCHETGGSASELPCVGWLVNQLGPGNNIALRLRVRMGQVDANVETVGEQHPNFQSTLPRAKKRRTRKAGAR